MKISLLSRHLESNSLLNFFATKLPTFGFCLGRLLSNIFLLLCLFVVLAKVNICHAEVLSEVKSEPLTEKTFEIKFGGADRSYTVYAPTSKNAEKLPVVLVLHGGMGNSEQVRDSTQMNLVAAKNHFVVVYPNGTSIRFAKNMRTWNAGTCCGLAQKQNIDDVGFIEKVIQELSEHYAIDSKRIYLTGMSNGGMLTYRLLCERPKLFAAVAPVAGVLLIKTCKEAEDVPVFHIHGSIDENVPYNGGVGKGISQVAYRSIPETIKIVTQSRSCQEPKLRKLGEGDVETTYNCKSGADFTLRILEGVPHAWAGSEKARKLSKNTFVASEEVWNFFKKYSKK